MRKKKIHCEDRVRVVKDTLTPSHVGREGRVIQVRGSTIDPKGLAIPRPIRVALEFGDMTMELDYAADELEVVK